MLRRTLLITIALVALAFLMEVQQGSQSKQTKRASQPRERASKRKPIRAPVRTFVSDSGGRELIVRVLDVGQGDATYIRNGESRVIIDGGPDTAVFGRYLDSLKLNNSTIDVVILSHQHLDHYSGLRELFKTARHMRVRYFFENKDPGAAVTLARLRDSILSRMDRDSLIYRDTDDPCSDGRPVCTITMTGGAKLQILAPFPDGDIPNNRSAAVKLIGPDSASFAMWLSGDAQQEEIDWFETAGYDRDPGMGVNILKANHHGSCNGVTPNYLVLTHPQWVVASLGAYNEYGHMHKQAKEIYRKGGVPWYRTDQNGTITIRSPGTPGGGFTITPERDGTDLDGPRDKRSRQSGCSADVPGG
ncbi:MAG TPA: MBL fold metallo-hydrolase [Gemmatimonadaceae bacterium]|nr:MBL fold metallo-hydrolase [Gemmatimonadaceae bacterium]